MVKKIGRMTRRTYSSEKKIVIVLAGLRGEESIAVVYCREGIVESLSFKINVWASPDILVASVLDPTCDDVF